MMDSVYAPTTTPLEKEDELAAYIVDNKSANEDKKIESFVIEEGFKNNAENRNKEATITVPYLVKKTADRDLVPRPFTSLRQLIVVSYCSFLCCIVTGAFANHFAWEALRYRDLGLLSESKKLSRGAARCIYISFALGLAIIIFICIPLIIVCGIMSQC